MKTLADLLTEMSEGKIADDERSYGLCKAVREAVGDSTFYDKILPIMEKYFSEWEEFSGDLVYPVRSYSCTDYGDASESYATYSQTENKWQGEYGAARMRLCKFLAEQQFAKDFVLDCIESNN